MTAAGDETTQSEASQPETTQPEKTQPETGGAGGRAGPGPGDPAPPFCLAGTGGREYCLGDDLGKPVLLVFYPADHSPVCTQQLRSYSEDLNEFEHLGAAVLCLSPQDVASHEDFARAQALRLPLLSDTDKEIGRAYGIVGPLGFYRRSIFIVDSEGVIRFARRSLTNLTFMATADLGDAIQAAQA